MLYEDAESTVSLAPAYDVITTTVYQAREVLALTLTNSKQFPSREALTAFGRSACGLSSARVKQVLERVEQGYGLRSATCDAMPGSIWILRE